MKTHARPLLSAAFALLTVASVSAQTVQYIIVSKEQYFTQNTNTTTTGPNLFRFEASVEGTGLGSITAPTLNTLPGTSTGVTGQLVQDPEDSNHRNFQQNFATAPLLEGNYQPGSYNLTVLGQSVTVGLPHEAPRFPGAPKATLSGGTIVNGVLVWDVSQSLTITLVDPLLNVSDPTNFAGVDHTSLSIWGQDIDRGAEAFGNGTLSVTIGGSGANNTFIAGNTYQVEMDFVNIIGGSALTSISGGALNGAQYAGIYSRTTSFTIQAVPEPSTYAALAGAAALGLACWHRRRKAPVAA